MSIQGFAPKNHNIDVVAISPSEKFILCLENKIDSGEHDDQLNRYRKIIEEAYPDYRKKFIYLSPEGAEASDPNNWCSMGYEDALNIVENARRRTKPLPDAQLLILCNIFPSNFDRFPLNIREKEPHFAFVASFCFISCKVAFILTKGVDRWVLACYTYAYVVLYIIYYFGAAGGNRDRRASSRQETG